MANITLSSIDSSIKMNFNDLAPKYKMGKIIRKKEDFNFDLLPDAGGVIINVVGSLKLTVYWNQLSIVDSVNGVAPTSNSDLYDKLCGLLISTESFNTLLDEASATITYVGKAFPNTGTSSPSWSISRIDSSSGVEILWASGTGYFNKIWDDRASYTYS